MFDSVPTDAAGYVFSAYLFFLLMVLLYIAILGAKFQRINRNLGELLDDIKADRNEAGDDPAKAPVTAASAKEPERAVEESGV